MARQALLALMLVLSLSAEVRAAEDSGDADILYEAGVSAFDRKRYFEALAFFSQANRLAPSAEVTRLMARTLSALGRYREAFNTYERYVTAFEISEGVRAEALAEQQRLEEHLALVQITTEPPGAELFVESETAGNVGTSPRRVAVRLFAGDAEVTKAKPGTTQVTKVIARAEGYHSSFIEVEAVVGKTVPASLVLTPRRGILVVTSDPPGAEVRLEGQAELLGTTPLELSLREGAARVVVSAPHRLPQLREGTVREGQRLALHVALVLDLNAVAVLVVESNVRSASVQLDGQVLGATPLLREGVEPGRRTVRVTAPGHDPWQTQVLFEPGSSTRVNAELVDPSKRRWLGWRWIAYGTGAVMLAAGAGVGLAARNARDDFFAGPDRDRYDSVDRLNLSADLCLGAGAVILAATAMWHVLAKPPAASQGTVRVDR